MENSCFLCAEECLNSNLYLINLETKKHKSKYTFLIGNLIKSEYEIRISKSDQICFKCSTILEKYDELEKETRILKSVLSRQIAHTYNIETDAEEIFLDKSKVFAEVRSNGSSDISQKYSCKQCSNYITDSLDTVNSHIIYHQIASEEAKQKVNSTNNNAVKTVVQTPTTTNNPKNITREVQKAPKTNSLKTANNIITQVPNTSPIQFQINTINNGNNAGLMLNEDTLVSLIDLKLLEDEFYDSNLIKHNCHVHNCTDGNFGYACDFIRHLKLKHKFTNSQLISAFKSNIKRPTQMCRLMCPYCFTKMASIELLEQHVKQHEMGAKGNLSERLNEFVSNVIKTSRCPVCDCECLDPTALTCNHEIVKNGMAPKINCVYCDEYFYSNKLYNNHLALKHGHCFVCGLTFSDRIILKDHIESHLSQSEYPCQFCKDIYQTSNNRRDHVRTKHPTHCCTYCDEWYVNQAELTHHMRFAHADLRNQEKASICDLCGQSFKSKNLYERHISNDHKQKKIYKCTSCVVEFKFRYLLMEHLSSVHNRTVVDTEVNFYKCCFCSRGFSSQNRQAFITHLRTHHLHNSFCYDCNTNTESVHHLETHRERCHQDFSKCVGKPKSDTTDVNKIPKVSNFKNQNQKINTEPLLQPSPSPVIQQQSQLAVQPTKPMQFELINSNLSAQPTQQPGQQIVLQSEDGSLLNMNNLILTENGELIIQNLDGLLPNGQEGDENSQIQISNLEQFLMEQGLSGNTEISYIQPDMIGDDSQVIIENNEAQQDSLLQTYKEIFEPNDELMGVTETEQQSQNMLLNGDYLMETPQEKAVSETVQQHSIEHVDVSSTQQALNAANQSTLDELGDILLEVAAAAEKEKKPKVSEQKALRETLWGKKRNLESIKEPNSKRRSGKLIEPTIESETPARDFSQAYEIFVKGFDAKKQKQF